MKRLNTTILFSIPALIFGGILLYFIFWNFRNSLMDYSFISSKLMGHSTLNAFIDKATNYRI
jgi:hypothetical protein